MFATRSCDERKVDFTGRIYLACQSLPPCTCGSDTFHLRGYTKRNVTDLIWTDEEGEEWAEAVERHYKAPKYVGQNSGTMIYVEDPTRMIAEKHQSVAVHEALLYEYDRVDHIFERLQFYRADHFWKDDIFSQIERLPLHVLIEEMNTHPEREEILARLLPLLRSGRGLYTAIGQMPDREDRTEAMVDCLIVAAATKIWPRRDPKNRENFGKPQNPTYFDTTAPSEADIMAPDQTENAPASVWPMESAKNQRRNGLPCFALLSFWRKIFAKPPNPTYFDTTGSDGPAIMAPDQTPAAWPLRSARGRPRKKR